MKPFLEGKKSVPGPALRPFVSAAPTATSCATAGTEAGVPRASVELIKDGDRVVRMIVHCACGERIDIECLY